MKNLNFKLEYIQQHIVVKWSPRKRQWSQMCTKYINVKTENKDSTQHKKSCKFSGFYSGYCSSVGLLYGCKNATDKYQFTSIWIYANKILLSLVHLPEQTTFHHVQLRLPPLASQSSIFRKIHTCRMCNPVYNLKASPTFSGNELGEKTSNLIHYLHKNRIYSINKRTH